MSDELDNMYHTLVTICLWADLDGVFALESPWMYGCVRGQKETLCTFVDKRVGEAGGRTLSSSEISELGASHWCWSKPTLGRSSFLPGAQQNQFPQSGYSLVRTSLASRFQSNGPLLLSCSQHHLVPKERPAVWDFSYSLCQTSYSFLCL